MPLADAKPTGLGSFETLALLGTEPPRTKTGVTLVLVNWETLHVSRAPIEAPRYCITTR